MNPPLTEKAAAMGTVSSLKLFCADGVRIGWRTLHKAARSAATCKVSQELERMAMLRFLVEEKRQDVNLLDTNGNMPYHYRTPTAHAAMEGGLDAVRYLLAMGADRG